MVSVSAVPLAVNCIESQMVAVIALRGSDAARRGVAPSETGEGRGGERVSCACRSPLTMKDSTGQSTH